MFKCFSIRKKLYDYSENSLSDADNLRVKRHLEVCISCQNRFNQMNVLLELARSKKTPRIQEGFWHDFNTGLDRKLNAALVPEFKFRPFLKFQFKPLLAYVSVPVFVLALTASLYFYSRTKIMGNSELALINEISLLDELTDEPVFNNNTDDYLEEIDFLERQNLNPA